MKLVRFLIKQASNTSSVILNNGDNRILKWEESYTIKYNVKKIPFRQKAIISDKLTIEDVIIVRLDGRVSSEKKAELEDFYFSQKTLKVKVYFQVSEDGGSTWKDVFEAGKITKLNFHWEGSKNFDYPWRFKIDFATTGIKFYDLSANNTGDAWFSYNQQDYIIDVINEIEFIETMEIFSKKFVNRLPDLASDFYVSNPAIIRLEGKITDASKLKLLKRIGSSVFPLTFPVTFDLPKSFLKGRRQFYLWDNPNKTYYVYVFYVRFRYIVNQDYDWEIVMEMYCDEITEGGGAY